MFRDWQANRFRWVTRCVLMTLLVAGCGSPTGPRPTEVPVRPESPTGTQEGTAPPRSDLQVVFDDDGSPDGTTALFYLVSHPQVTVLGAGISYGEAHPEEYIQHIARKLDKLGIHGIAFGAGQDSPLAGNNEFPEWMRQAAGEFWGHPIPNADKTYPVQDAAELIVSIANQASEPVTLFVSGPSTNLAQALRLDPSIRDKIVAVYIMGGAVHVRGNIDDLLPDADNSVAEWNIYADPQAAMEVFESGLEIYLVPLDATNQVTVGREDTTVWRQGGASAKFAADIYDALFDAWDAEEAAVWDLMTAAIMVRPDLCAFEPLHLEVTTTEGDTAGQTVLVADEDPNAYVCLEPDVDLIKQSMNEDFSTSR
jgi:purine nucleosidase/pyrimidine-specific ribonucleoside hydrolase